MMNIDPSNPVIRNAIKKAMEDDNDSFFTCHDYENCKIQINKDLDKNAVYFSFTCHNFKEIYEAGKQFFVKQYLSEYQITSEPLPGYDITFQIDLSGIKELKKIPKNLDAQEEERLQEERKQQKEKNKQIINSASQSFSKFKKHFYGSPYEYILDGHALGTINPPEKVSFSTRKNERIWIVSENKEQMTVYYGIKFEDIADKTISQMVIDEMPESTRLIQNAPSVKKGKYPEAIQNHFPDDKKLNLKFDNGLLSITLFKKTHIDGCVENAATFLQGYRQYIHYHVHASKSYLHSRLLNRINFFYRSVQDTKFQKDSDKYYRTRKEANLLIKGDEEEDKDTLNKQILQK